MNNPVPLEYVTSFAQTNQALMQHLATALLSGGDRGAAFHSYAEVAQAQQDYHLQRMNTLWLGAMMDAVPAYLVNARYVNDLIERSSVDERTRGRMRFFESLSKGCGGNFCATPRRQTGGRPSPAELARPRAAMSRRAPTEALTVELVHDHTREVET
jgi:hypothetical protein